MIARKSSLIFGTQIVTAILGYIGLVVFARLWGDFSRDALGYVSFAMGFVGLFNVVADLGFGSAYVKRVTERGANKEDCLATYALVKGILLAAMIILLLTGLAVWTLLLGHAINDATTMSVIYVIVAYYIIINLGSIASQTFISRREIAKKQLSTIFETIVRVPLLIMVALAGVTGVAAIAPRLATENIYPVGEWPGLLKPLQDFISAHAVGSLAMTYVLGALATAVVSFLLLRKVKFGKPRMAIFKSYFRFALPIMIVSVIGVISANIDKVTIGYFWSGAEVGDYFATMRIITIFASISAAVGTLLFPTISEYHSRNKHEAIVEVTTLAERYVSMIMVPPVAFILVLASPSISIIISKDYAHTGIIFSTLAIYTFLSSILMPHSTLTAGTNKPKVNATIGAVVCISNIGLNILLVPAWSPLSSIGVNGAAGAAVATMAALAIANVMLRIYTHRTVGIISPYTAMFKHLAGGVAMGVFLFLLNMLHPMTRWFELLLYAGSGLLIYLGTLALLGEFGRHEVEFFLNVLHPKKMAGYVIGELKEKRKKE